MEDTLTDPRGWVRAGFEIRVTADARNVVLVAEPDEVDARCVGGAGLDSTDEVPGIGGR